MEVDADTKDTSKNDPGALGSGLYVFSDAIKLQETSFTNAPEMEEVAKVDVHPDDGHRLFIHRETI